jgi:2-polyprenyl-3-methyl-5-hydroxy-6-metoxy-1,4-benzoquinol methylase
MIDFSRRSYQKELLDSYDIPFEDIKRNMQELEFINTYLGGHLITINGFKQLLKNNKKISVCEIGCGGGDNLNAINKWCTKNNVTASYTGIDINPNCIAFAHINSRIKNVNFITSDYKLVRFNNQKPDIVFSSLFCHHFTNEELIEMMKWMDQNASIGFFINDLHRHPIAYHFIKFATNIFSKSYLVKNDAALSVLRGFTKQEWIHILQQAGISNYSIKWKWAFRFLIAPVPQGKLR